MRAPTIAWAESLDIGDGAILHTLAAEVGLPADDASDVLESERFLDVVQASTRQAVAIGVTGVPGFLLHERLLIVGAQPDAVFEQALARLG